MSCGQRKTEKIKDSTSYRYISRHQIRKEKRDRVASCDPKVSVNHKSYLLGHRSVCFMEAVLNCKPEDLEDYYGVLGCDELSSTEQIINEYKIRALACHPDKHPDNPKAVEEFQKLQEAKETLCDESHRKNYDLWKRSGVVVPFHNWRALNDSVKTSMHWAVRTKKEPMLEEGAKAEFPVISQAEDTNIGQESQSESVSSTSDYCHRRFRWAADSPSSLLQKFRNYEI